VLFHGLKSLNLSLWCIVSHALTDLFFNSLPHLYYSSKIFYISVFRSAEVGKLLADVLISREQGQRPVTLVGFSLGARVLYYCLRVGLPLSYIYSILFYSTYSGRTVYFNDSKPSKSPDGNSKSIVPFAR